MNKPVAVVLMALSFSAAAVCFGADNPHLGTWKLDDSKSSIPAGIGKNSTVIYTAEKDMFKITTEGVDAKGKPTHGMWMGRFDGKARPVHGNLAYNSLAIKMVDDHTNDLTGTKDSKKMWWGRATISADGKMRTVNLTGIGADGKKMKEMLVYEKK